MPADSTRNTLLRQWELLRLLPAHGAGLSADALCKELKASGFTVSKRQVERDLKALSEIFPLDCNDKGIPYGWRWTEGRSADLPGITLTDAISLRVVEETLRPLLPDSVLKAVEPRFRQATMKLRAMADGNRAAHWVNKVRTVSPTLPLLPPQILPEHLECIQNALLADEQIEVEYLARNRVEAKNLTLNPLGLIQSGPVTYLVATAFNYSEPRLSAAPGVCISASSPVPISTWMLLSGAVPFNSAAARPSTWKPASAMGKSWLWFLGGPLTMQLLAHLG